MLFCTGFLHAYTANNNMSITININLVKSLLELIKHACKYIPTPLDIDIRELSSILL